jgi:transcriptional regulator with XRE-family HTH domain
MIIVAAATHTEPSVAIPAQAEWPEVAFDARWAREVHTARKRRKMNQEQLAAAAGVSQGRISQIEKHRDQPTIVSSSAVIPIGRALKIPLPILGEDEDARRWREAGVRLRALDAEIFAARLAEVERLVSLVQRQSGSTDDESSD